MKLKMYDLNKICRICLSVENVVKSIFSSNTDSTLLFCDMLMAVSTVKIQYNDGLPSQICLKCINKIMQAYSFKRECEKSEKILLNYVSETTNQIEVLDCSDEDSSQNILKNEVKYMCHTCNKNFATSSSLKKHLRTQHTYTETNNTEKKVPEKNILVKCDWCEYVFISEFTLKKHISSKHRNKKLKSFESDEQELIPEYETKTIAKCSFCNYVFANEDHLKKHLLAKHLNNEYDTNEIDKQGNCDLCGIHSKNIQLHMNEHYKHLYCTNCSLKFEKVDSFEEHMKQNLCKKNTSYLCSICGKIYNQLSNFRIHSLIHGKQKQYSCTICDRSFTTPTMLSLHVKNHTHVQPYVCGTCGQSFKQSSELTIHKRIHSNERSLQCNICCKQFNTNVKLNFHKRIHAGEKPYTCKICNKKFALSGTLRKHSRTHMGEMPHVCNVCGKQFSQNSSLFKHLKTHE